jgi:hypothetical protein
MASTYKPRDAFDFAKLYIKNMNLEKVGVRILDDVNKMMWMAAPWRWTIGSLSAVTLVSNTSDYTIVPPGDFLYLHSAYISDGSTPPRDLHVDPVLPSAVTVVGQPSRIAVASTTLRLAPKPGTQPTSAPNVIALYKKTAPTITAANMGTAGTQVFDDEWFWVFQEGVLWRAYMYGDDARAGSATVTSDGKAQYSGQRGIFEAGLSFMRQNEKLFLPGGKQDV